MTVLLIPHPLQHELSSALLILATLTGIGWNLKVVLICVSLTTKGIKHSFEVFLSHLSFLSGEFHLDRVQILKMGSTFLNRVICFSDI